MWRQYFSEFLSTSFYILTGIISFMLTVFFYEVLYQLIKILIISNFAQ